MQFVRHEPLVLLLGDLIVFYAALWLTLLVRYVELPSSVGWWQHAVPFSFLFLLSVLIYFIVGLYDQHTSFQRSKLPSLVAYGQTATVIFAALFFFLVPYFGITPKTILAIFLAISSILMVFWRLVLTRYLGVRGQGRALVVGTGEEMNELAQEINAGRYGLTVVEQYAPEDIEVSPQLQEQILEHITRKGITTLIIDTRNKHMTQLTPVFYNLLFLQPNLTILDALTLYENIFRRIPVSMLEDTWFIEHITRQPRMVYDLMHRAMDVVSSVVLGIPALLVLPFAALAVKREDGGPIFITQHRIGKLNKPVAHVKVRSMQFNDERLHGAAHEARTSVNRVTRVGNILRKTRIDELPQLWNIFVGDYSLIGPRPELPDGVKHYAEIIPYYNARHLIKPGLTGWAQINHHEHPHHGLDVEQTRNKLSYDLYYLKNRTLWLDLEIGLKTLKTLLTAVGK